jgi:hypothetical protein
VKAVRPSPWPLRTTSLITAVLLLVPAVALRLFPRPRAEGLERLLPQASLLQSFPAAPERSAPPLWRQRLGAADAARLWRLQRGLWWQFWGRDGDGGPFLVFIRPAPAAAALSRTALAVDDLVVLAPDPLSRRQLADQLGTASRQRRGLERRCLERLQTGEAVYWSPVGLAEVAAVLAPLLQQGRQGCLSLVPLTGDRRRLVGLGLSGEAGSASGLLGDVAPAAASGPAPAVPPDSTLLQLQGPSLAPLLQSLLVRQLIREPLATRYGLADAQVRLFTGVPFRLQLHARASGPFRAGLDLQLAVGADRRPWAALLAALRQGLLSQGLQEAPAPSTTAAAADRRPQPLAAASFQRDDGTVVGGWRWQASGAAAPGLLLFLGTPPPAGAPLSAPPARGPLRLWLRPAAMDQAGLMPASLPRLVRRASLLELNLNPADGPLSRLTGRLRLATTQR